MPNEHPYTLVARTISHLPGSDQCKIVLGKIAQSWPSEPIWTINQTAGQADFTLSWRTHWEDSFDKLVVFWDSRTNHYIFQVYPFGPDVSNYYDNEWYPLPDDTDFSRLYAMAEDFNHWADYWWEAITK